MAPKKVRSSVVKEKRLSKLKQPDANVQKQVVARHPKMLKPGSETLTPLELTVAQTLDTLESSNADLKRLKDLYACGAKEMTCGKSGQKAIVIFVPVPFLKKFQAIQSKLIEEMEGRLGGRFVILLAWRRILPKPNRKMAFQPKQRRPDNRTLTAVHNAWLEELVFPCEIVGKRTRIRADGSRLIKVHLDKLPEAAGSQDRLECYTNLYKAIAGKEIVFEVPQWTFRDI